LTTTILLIRHALHAEVGTVLSGRRPGLALSERGAAQAEQLARRLAGCGLVRVETSPLERARQTAEPIAVAAGLTPQVAPALNEVDFGAWTGRAFSDLAGDPLWQRWNADRAVAQTPGGETMAAAQERAWAHCVRTALALPCTTVAMVSHCDVIRAVLARVLDLSLNRLLSFDLAPASVSRLEVGEHGARVLSINDTAHLECAAAEHA